MTTQSASPGSLNATKVPSVAPPSAMASPKKAEAVKPIKMHPMFAMTAHRAKTSAEAKKETERLFDAVPTKEGDASPTEVAKHQDVHAPKAKRQLDETEEESVKKAKISKDASRTKSSAVMSESSEEEAASPAEKDRLEEEEEEELENEEVSEALAKQAAQVPDATTSSVTWPPNTPYRLFLS